MGSNMAGKGSAIAARLDCACKRRAISTMTIIARLALHKHLGEKWPRFRSFPRLGAPRPRPYPESAFATWARLPVRSSHATAPRVKAALGILRPQVPLNFNTTVSTASHKRGTFKWEAFVAGSCGLGDLRPSCVTGSAARVFTASPAAGPAIAKRASRWLRGSTWRDSPRGIKSPRRRPATSLGEPPAASPGERWERLPVLLWRVPRS